MIPELARRLVAGDQTALDPLHTAVLTELALRGTVAHLIGEFELPAGVALARQLGVQACEEVPLRRWYAVTRSEVETRIAAVHLVAVMMACAFDELRQASLNASLARPSTAA